MIEIKDTDFFLVQFTGTNREIMHGPFRTETKTWEYLFGKTPTLEDIALHKQGKWSVRPAVEQIADE